MRRVIGDYPGRVNTAHDTVGAQVGLQIGKRNSFTLQGLTLEESAKSNCNSGQRTRKASTQYFLQMPAHNVTVTVPTGRQTARPQAAVEEEAAEASLIPDTKIPTGIYEHGTVTVSPESASKGDTVTITAAPDKGYELSGIKVIDQNGRKVKLTDKGSGKYTFTMPVGKVTIKADFIAQTVDSVFADVSADAYYYEAVKWAAGKGITGGIGDSLFAPNQSCTRAQIVTFLWRAAGSPEPKQLSTFGDVPADAYYAKAVAWAVENGITDGTSDTTFAPGTICTRAHGVTFCLLQARTNTASGNSNFADVDVVYYASAVKWAVDNGITNGALPQHSFGLGQYNASTGCYIPVPYQASKQYNTDIRKATEKTGLESCFFDNLVFFRFLSRKPTAVSLSFIEIVQTAKEFFIIRFFTDGIDA